jgi:hypothetical protein
MYELPPGCLPRFRCRAVASPPIMRYNLTAMALNDLVIQSQCRAPGSGGSSAQVPIKVSPSYTVLRPVTRHNEGWAPVCVGTR